MASSTFELKEFHLELLRELRFQWNEQELAPQVKEGDPYGPAHNDSLASVYEIYARFEGYELLTNELGESSFVAKDGQVIDAEDIADELWRYHRDLPTVLEIVTSDPLRGVTFGNYQRGNGGRWEPIR